MLTLQFLKYGTKLVCKIQAFIIILNIWQYPFVEEKQVVSVIFSISDIARILSVIKMKEKNVSGQKKKCPSTQETFIALFTLFALFGVRATQELLRFALEFM